ncbi:MAG: hypothetical protein OXU63_10685 [Acidobacteriota bacterium]|nr:hypothetical protein [Acidobacteriota bacterium]
MSTPTPPRKVAGLRPAADSKGLRPKRAGRPAHRQPDLHRHLSVRGSSDPHPARSAGLRALVAVAAFALFAALPAPAAAECEAREAEGPVTVESCPIENADYPVVRAEMTVRGSMAGVIALLSDADACPEWQAMCVEERATALDAPFRTLRQRVSGKGISRRITMDRAAWWRTADGGVVGDMAGADDLTPEFKGKRVLCVRSRWFLSPGDGEGTVTVVQKTVSDPQPPFGMGAGVVTPRTAKTLLETFTNMSTRLASGQHGAGPAIESLPLLEAELPGVGEEFARCQAARK